MLLLTNGLPFNCHSNIGGGSAGPDVQFAVIKSPTVQKGDNPSIRGFPRGNAVTINNTKCYIQYNIYNKPTNHHQKVMSDVYNLDQLIYNTYFNLLIETLS